MYWQQYQIRRLAFNYITNINGYSTEHYFSSEMFHLFNLTIK